MNLNKNVYIIAEAGVNHNGRLDLALELIQKAKESGADCVKFQTFKAEQIVTKDAPKANYQLLVTNSEESQFEMLKKLELDFDDYLLLIKKCKELEIDFLSTPYNKEDVDFLDKLGVIGFKIASGQLTEIPLLKYIAKKGKQIILSTGMASLSEVFDSVQAILDEGNSNICVLQCTTNYPSRIEDANILAMKSIEFACKINVGYSDHVSNNYACYSAVALGAKIIEKHFTLDKSFEGPDHTSSLDPKEFKELVFGIRQIVMSLGTGIKIPSREEIKNSYGMKRSLVALCDLEAGAIIEEKHIGFKRPANGMHPNNLSLIIGKKLNQGLLKDEAIQNYHIKWDMI
jgi:N-acetylneuraminate synthase/N,N'-diacetyllegionaminate synthase